MISLKRKKGSGRHYKWRSNFRDVEHLAELKAFRLQFFIPLIALTLAVFLLGYVGFKEYSASVVASDTAALIGKMSDKQADHDDIVKKNGEFRKISNRLQEVIDFKKDKLVASDFLLGVTQELSEGIYLLQVQARPDSATIEGVVSVAAEEASAMVDSFMERLQEANVTQGLFTEYVLVSFDRDKTMDRFRFKIEITKEDSK